MELHGQLFERVAADPESWAGPGPRTPPAPFPRAEPPPVLALLGDDTVYRRTPAGRREAVVGRLGLAANERRMLLIVNGETPLRVLLDLLRLEDESVVATVLRLVELRLIERHVPPIRPPAPGWPGPLPGGAADAATAMEQLLRTLKGTA